MKQILTRLALTLPVVWLVVSLVFLLIHLVPGDPIVQMLGDGATAADISALRHQYGLDQPLWEQYVHYWTGVLHGDLGTSIRMRSTVFNLVSARYPYTLALTMTALGFGLALALPAGVLAAVRRGRWLDQLLSVVSLFGLSVPGLALGPVLILVFSIQLGWLPVSGANSGGGRSIDWHYLVLPSVAMGASLAAILTRMIRTAMLEELGQDYIRTARAKGLSEMADWADLCAGEPADGCGLSVGESAHAGLGAPAAWSFSPSRLSKGFRTIKRIFAPEVKDRPSPLQS
ncbi:MAG: ABC transporter permease [Terracidiphilus sp.]